MVDSEDDQATSVLLLGKNGIPFGYSWEIGEGINGMLHCGPQTLVKVLSYLDSCHQLIADF